MWLLGSWGFCKKQNSPGVPDATRHLIVEVPAHDGIAVASSVVHNLGLSAWLRDPPAWQSPLLTLAAKWRLGEMPLVQILPLLLNWIRGKFWPKT